MRVAAALTGLPLHQGDELRRAIGAARTDAERASLERGFVQSARRAGVDEATALAVWRDLARFGAYAFCKAHAAGYGTLAYHCAYLKTHFPAEFAVGILNHHAGMYETWVHVEDLRRQGVRFLAPCARRSAWDAALETEQDPPRSPMARPEEIGPCALAAAVRVGLSRVSGLAETTGARILRARAARPFTSLADFTDRVRPSLPELESLVLAGALDWTGRTRPSLLLEARTTDAVAPARRTAVAVLATDEAALLHEARAPIAVPELPEFDREERVRGERAACGLWFTAHPLEIVADAPELSGAAPAAHLDRLVGRRVAVVGLPCAYRRVETRQGDSMLFVTLADRSGLAECVLFPDAYRANAGALRGDVLRAEGRVEETLGAVTLTVERLVVALGI